jgi:oligoendopeptidase F
MRTVRALSALLFLFVLLSPTLAEEPQAERLLYETRDEIPVRYQWNLGDIFASVDDWNRAYAEVDASIPKVETIRGHLGDSPEALASGLKTVFGIMERLDNIIVYSGQNRDMLTTDQASIERFNRAQSLAARFEQAVAFIDPEISQIPEARLALYRKDPAVAAYDHYIDDIVRNKPHIRSAEVEEVLASASLMAGAPQEAYNNLVDADIEWPKIRDENGEEATATPALYYSFLAKQDRNVRRDAALSMFRTYDKFGNTMAATYDGHVQRDIFYTKNRKFDTTLEAKLFDTNVPPEVVETLVRTVHDNYAQLHRYIALRKEILGIDDFHVYDLYVSMVPQLEKKMSFEEGYKLALDFWKKTYGEEYYAVGKRAYDERWIDVYANKGKRGGAYSWGTFDSHPYLLLNWGGNLDDVFTLVHEMGHSIHTYLASKNQPYHYAGYSTFVAEVASVASEALFLDYMLERAENDTERLYLLDTYMGNITGTFIRQIFFHEFEAIAHQKAEAGEALTKETLSEIHGNLWKDYYGPELVLDDEFKADWMRIPHFYRTFYVWSYASSFAAGEAIAERVRSKEKGAVGDFLAMLKLGDSVYPMDALKTGGVDMTDPKVIQTVMTRYGQTLDKMTPLLRKLHKK